MTLALGPKASPTAAASAPWTVLACCWVLVGVASLGWVGVRVAAVLGGGTTARYGWEFFEDVLTGCTSRVWSGVPGVLVECVAVLYLAAAGVAVGVWLVVRRHRAAPGDPVAALADNPAMAQLMRGPVTRRAVRLRASLAGVPSRSVAAGDIGLAVGCFMRRAGGGLPVYASWEDTVVAFMAPRSGKTTMQAIPSVLSAPGAVIATSDKADLWAATSAIRAHDTGERIAIQDAGPRRSAATSRQPSAIHPKQDPPRIHPWPQATNTSRR